MHLSQRKCPKYYYGEVPVQDFEVKKLINAKKPGAHFTQSIRIWNLCYHDSE